MMMYNSNSEITDKVWSNLYTSFCLCLLWQEQRRTMQLSGTGRGRNGACHTGAFGRQTSLDGWRSYTPRRLTTGCRTWLTPSGLTSPLAASWATIVLSPMFNMRSEAAETQGADKIFKFLRIGICHLWHVLMFMFPIINCSFLTVFLVLQSKCQMFLFHYFWPYQNQVSHFATNWVNTFDEGD